MKEIICFTVFSIVWLTSCSVFSPDTQGGDSKTGNLAVITTGSHGVSGKVTVKSQTELLVDNFYYDGGGISVYFYLGTANNSESSKAGKRIGPQLYGTARTNATLTLSIPNGTTLADYKAVSVWCETAGVSFGSGLFKAP